MTPATVSPWLIDALWAQAAFAFLFPTLLGWLVQRRLRVGWRWWFYGMRFFLLAYLFQFGGGLVFGIFSGIYKMLAPAFHWRAIPVRTIFFWTALTAGPAEEGARYIGYRRRATASWNEGVMYGLGHGALESMWDKTTSSIWGIVILLYFPGLHPQSAFAQGFVKGVMVHWPTLASRAAWEPLLAIVAIAGVQALHATNAVMVLQCFRRGEIGWLYYAMAFHSGADLMIFGAAAVHTWLGNIVSICCAILCLYILFRLRDSEPEQLELAIG